MLQLQQTIQFNNAMQLHKIIICFADLTLQ